MRLGVSPAATPTPTGVFNQRFEALFRCAGALAPAVCPGLSMRQCGALGFATSHSACPVLRHSESGPLGLSVSKCGAAGSASGQTACPARPTLRQSQSRHSNVSPLRPGCPSLPWLPVSAPASGLDECLFFIYLVSDFLAV